MKLVLSMKILGTYPYVIDEIRKGNCLDMDKRDYYDIIFKIYQDGDYYQLICKLPNAKVQCGYYESEVSAKTFMNYFMKKAMKGSLVYHRCIDCWARSYYPAISCDKCDGIFYPISDWVIEEIENQNMNHD